MNKYQIINPAYTGEIEVLYNSNGIVESINFLNTNLAPALRLAFLKTLPINERNLQTAFKTGTTIVAVEVTITYEQFYEAYPKKRNSYKARKDWQKLSNAQQIKAYYSIQGYKKYLQRNDWISPMLADSYLTRREFETDWNKEK
jgi:hypothetical protein